MIKLLTQNKKIHKTSYYILEDRVSKLTCKTNLSPQLIFKQSFTGFTFKKFIGNWTDYGFWVSKFRLQLIELRPDIIAKFYINQNDDISDINIQYIIGFSSLLMGAIWILLFAAPFLGFGLIGYIIGIIIMSFIYYLITQSSLDISKNLIFKELLNELEEIK